MSTRKRDPVGTAVLVAISAVIVAADWVVRVLTHKHRPAKPEAPPVDGSHEACDLSLRDRLAFERYSVHPDLADLRDALDREDTQ